MTVLLLSLVLALAGCTGLILAGRGMWQGWAVGLAVQPVWAAFAIVTRGYGLLLTCLMYGTVYGRNLRAWRRKPKAAPCTHSSITVSFVGGVGAARCATCGELLPQVMVGSGVLEPTVLP